MIREILVKLKGIDFKFQYAMMEDRLRDYAVRLAAYFEVSEARVRFHKGDSAAYYQKKYPRRDYERTDDVDEPVHGCYDEEKRIIRVWTRTFPTVKHEFLHHMFSLQWGKKGYPGEETLVKKMDRWPKEKIKRWFKRKRQEEIADWKVVRNNNSQ